MSNISDLNFLSSVEDSSATSEVAAEEIQRRLSAYQVFVRLYENHRSLLEQILKLENLSTSSLKKRQLHYVQAVIDGEIVYVTTNLCNDKSQCLRQSQHTWTIGRERNNGIQINNKYLSRHHAAIRYINQEFYLIDFNSTNGTCINDEKIYQQTKLKDGDIIGLGNITFSFFNNNSCRILPTVAIELLMQSVPKISGQADKSTFSRSKTKTRNICDSEALLQAERECIQDQSLFNEVAQMHNFEQQLSQQWKSDILDSFYSKQAMENSILSLTERETKKNSSR